MSEVKGEILSHAEFKNSAAVTILKMKDYSFWGEVVCQSYE